MADLTTTADLRARLADIRKGYEAATADTVRALQLALVERVAASLKDGTA